MANNTISQVTVNGTTYDLLDANTLSAVSALNTRVTALESSVDLFKVITSNRLRQIEFDLWYSANGDTDVLQIGFLRNDGAAYYLFFSMATIELRKKTDAGTTIIWTK